MILEAAGEDESDHARLLRDEAGMFIKAPDWYAEPDPAPAGILKDRGAGLGAG